MRRDCQSQLEFERIAGGAADTPRQTDDAWSRGFAMGAEELLAHYWGYELYFLKPCIGADTSTRSTIDAIDRFAREYPELLYRTSPTLLVTKAVFYGLCPGPA